MNETRRQKKLRRAVEAEGRQAAHDARTPREQFDLVCSRRGNSTKESRKLMRLIYGTDNVEV